MAIGFIGTIGYLNTIVENFKMDSIATHDKMQKEYQSLIKNSNAAHDEILQKAKQGTMWLLRDDILKTIDLHTQTKLITMKQYKCIKDEYDYYVSIGGNHDVKEKYDHFVAKIFGLGEIKMITSTNTPNK
jgi:hypothetical protein